MDIPCSSNLIDEITLRRDTPAYDPTIGESGPYQGMVDADARPLVGPRSQLSQIAKGGGTRSGLDLGYDASMPIRLHAISSVDFIHR